MRGSGGRGGDGGAEGGGTQIQFQICGFRRSVWKLNVNKVLFHRAMIYGAGAGRRIEQSDSPHIGKKRLDNKAAGKKRRLTDG